MSESEVSHIRDEDVLRRMWQQTEDFSRKKEIRAHMYRLREERLRNLYSPEPTPDGKGCEFTSAQGHVQSFADQTFQSMKSKEVRDAGSPPKEFAYRGQDLKELSNAGWNVESEDRRTDDGRTHVKSVNANIEGRYDVEGGRGQFAAVDRQRQAVSEYRDDHSSLRRDETSSDTAAHEHVVRQTDDGTRVSSTTSSSNTSSKFQQVSSTKHDTVPYVNEDYDQSRRIAHETNRNEQVTKITNKNDYEQTLRKSDFVDSELVSRKVEYPDDSTKVIVETRCLPDGTRVTSTRREFRAPAQSTRSEYQTKSESKSYSSQHKSDTRDSTSKTTRHLIDKRTNDIVDSQRNVDDYDFKRQLHDYTVKDSDDFDDTQQRYVTKFDKKVTDYTQTDDDHSQKRYETRVSNKVVDQSSINRDDHLQTQHRIIDRRGDNRVDEIDRRQTSTTRDHDVQHQIVKEKRFISDTEEKIHNTTRERKDTDEKTHYISRNRTDIEGRIRDIPADRPVPMDKSRDSPRDGTVPEEKVCDSSRPKDETIPVEKFRDIPKERTVPEERIRDIPRDRTVPVQTFREVPRDGTVPEGNYRHVPRDRTVPEQRFREVPRDGTVPEQTFREVPRAGVVPEERGRNVPRDKSTPEDSVHNVPKDKSIPVERDDIPRDRMVTDKKVHNIVRDTKVEEVVQRKTTNDHYQTTYQNDYQTRKISTDWSPTHQAWASTLRSDTPSTTRPSTRASSPGSRTFKSSTSSLRSSVSPDKSSRKPSSRGGSPNKIDRYSPTRTVTSDRYSSTHSTHSVTEVKTNKNTSPERKPPTGRSPTTSGQSPDRKPQDVHRQRPSVSPEKRPQNFTDRPNSSPERKPYQKSTTDKTSRTTSPTGKRESPRSPTRPKQSPERRPTYHPSDESPSDVYPRISPYRSAKSPERKPTDSYSNRTSPRTSPSPDRKSGHQNPTDSPTTGYPRTSSPSRPNYPTEVTDTTPRKSGTSPDRKPSYQQPQQSQDKPVNKHPTDSTTKRPSVSPDRKPSYMRPTAASQPDDKTKKKTTPEDEPQQKSPTKQVLARSPDRNPQDVNKTSKIKEDHYRFVDEETKVYTRTDKTDIHKKVTKTSTPDDSHPRDKSPSQVSKIPSEDSPDFCVVPIKKGKSPSPQNDTTKNIENDQVYDKTDKTVELMDIAIKRDMQTEDKTTVKSIPKNKESPVGKDVPSRESSPSKYGTYDKKKPQEFSNITEVTTATTEDIKDVKYDSTRRDKTLSKNVPDIPSSPTKKTPRDSTSPMKSPTKDTKYKHTTDFLTTERTTEEITKKTTAKEHPRQLITPSSSPTRKPKTTETEPSTGQSSPTTSVSGFVYFGSPRPEKPMVTDLDEFYPESEKPDEITKRPETLDLKRSPSPSKIPCRSPSPEKQAPTTKDSLPRKSSLKKPLTDVSQASPIEKPPTSFRVSPTDDKPDLHEHKVVKKDRPNEPETGEPEIGKQDSTVKPKPPLQRRETYEDRCKKILGMVEDTTTKAITKETRKDIKKPVSNQSSPSVSPCDSPIPKELSPVLDYPATKKTSDTKVDVTDFITHEQEGFIKVTEIRDGKKTKNPSRESSPSKPQDIKTKTTLTSNKTTKEDIETDEITRSVTTKSSRRSPEKPSHKPTEQTRDESYLYKMSPSDSPNNTFQKRPNESPERKPLQPSRPKESSPSKSTLSPERKPLYKNAKETPSKTSPDKTPDSTSKTTSVTIHDTTSTTEDVQETTKIAKKSQPTRILESPTRQLPKSTQGLPDHSGQPRTHSPSKPQPKEGSLVRKPASDNSTFESDYPEDNHLKPEDLRPDITRSRPRDSPERMTSHKKPTTTTSKYDTINMTYTTEELNETYSTRTQEKKEPQTKTSTSPSRKTPQGAPQTNSPSKPSQLSGNYNKEPDSSPQKMPIRDTTRKEPRDEEPKESFSTKPRDVPGYMKITTASVTKLDTTTISENVQGTTKLKTVETKRVSSGLPDSPIRKTSQPKYSPEHRTPSPTKMTRPLDISPDRKHSRPQQPLSPNKENQANSPGSKHPTTPSTTRPGSEKIPGYLKPTASVTPKHDTNEYGSTMTEDIQETITSTTTDRKYPVPKNTESPLRQTPKSTEESAPERKTSPSRPSHPAYDKPRNQSASPERKPGHQRPSNEPGKPVDKHPKELHPHSPENTTGYIKTTTAVTSKFDTTSTRENIEENVTHKKVYTKQPSETPIQGSPKTGDRPRSQSPSKPTNKASRTSTTTSPDRDTSFKSPVKDTHPERNQPRDNTPGRSISSPERPSYMKSTASVTSKYDSTITTQDTQNIHEPRISKEKTPSPRSLVSPGRQSPEREPRENLSNPEEPRKTKTLSPIKKTTKVTEANTEFIMTEREQEILDKVQKSLRKLSPERKERSPSRERSPTKSTTSLQDLDIITTETIQTDKMTKENLSEVVEEQITITSRVTRPGQLKMDKSNEPKSSNKPSSRNVSPIKRAPSTPTSNKVDKSPETPTKSRSISPKKTVSHVERPQSPQVSKASGIKPRDQIPAHLTRKPTPATLAPTKVDRLTTDVKKTSGVTKQNVFMKTTTSKTINRSIPSPTSKGSEPEFKRAPTPKGLKENISPKKDAVTRTASDIGMKPKKTSSPQRMKSKPEIQVSDMSTKSPKSQKPTIKEPHSKLPSKPKSATALNTSTDEDDIIIDVQQSKSSRENSPDRICPTPINFSDDVGTPRFPDEVSEPDDELVKRTYHTIHETESVVDDIVEICEDEELFVKKTDMDVITEHDDSLLSVNDKVSKFTNKMNYVTKPKDTTHVFKDTERRVHSDFLDKNLKSDECLLTVSEKVNKFAKGPRDTKDSRSPSRKITEEYDRDTVYQDDYTKLSVNDKAHLFVETAENVKVSKLKPAQKVERPDLSHVDESLKSDDCLLSVSDKVNKFVKTAEQYLTETQVVEETENKIKEQHEKILKQITNEDDDNDDEPYYSKETINTEELDSTDTKPIDRPTYKSKPHTEESNKTPLPRQNDYSSPSSKQVERIPTVKITTLRSSEAVKKAKALFENIASTQKITQKEITHTAKTTKLTDIGVIKKSPKTDSTTVLHPSVEDMSPQISDVDSEVDTPNTKNRPLSGTSIKSQYPRVDEKLRSSPNRLTAQSPEVHRSKSPMRQSVEVTTTKTVLSRYPAVTRTESPRPRTESPRPRTESPRQRSDSDKPDKVPGYLRPTKTSQIKEESKVLEETEVSSRRGSGKFGVELRRTSIERSTISSERRRSVEHHQPCIEDIFDLDLLEQMLEKVVGYEQRRRIRSQIRVAKNQTEHVVDSNTYTTKTTKQATSASKNRSPERKPATSPERVPKSPQKTASPDRYNKSSPHKTIPDHTQPKEPIMNGHTKEPARTVTTQQSPRSPEKPAPKSSLAPKTPVRQPSPDKRRTVSPTKVAPKPKGNRFNEYASAYMKKVGLNESDKVKFTDTTTKKKTEVRQKVKRERQQETVQEFTTTKSFTERTSSKDVIEIVQTNGRRSLSPEQRQSPERKVQFPDQEVQSPERKAQSPVRKVQSPVRKTKSPERNAQTPERRTYSPERKAQSPERLHQRTPSPDFKRPKADTVKDTIIKTVYDSEKKIPSKPVQEGKPSWVTNRNLRKITSETRTYSTKKIENEKPKYRAPSPSKVISKPIDVITSSYGPGPLDADGKPLFGIKALRNGASNFQVKGTVIRQEFHSRNGGEPEGSVSVTAYSSQPEELEQLLAQGGEPPSRIHGLAAITTTKKFGGDTGHTLTNVHTKEDRASLEQFTHHDRRVEHLESRYDRTHDLSEDTRREEITGSTRREDLTGNRRIESRKDDRQTDRNDRSTRREERVTEVKRGQKVEERREKMEKREDKKTVRQSSVKSLTEKYIKSASDSGKADRSTYPKAGLILRTTTMRDSVSSDDGRPGLVRTDSEHSLGSVDDTVVTTTERSGDGVRTTTTRTTHHHGPTVTTHTRGSTVITQHEPVITTKKTSTVITQEPVITHRVISQEPVITRVITQEPMVKVTQGHHGSTVTTERSFLDSSTKVTGVQDILTRMKNADIVIQEGDTTEDSEARALLNKFLGATVLMAGMQGYVSDQPSGKLHVKQESVRSSSSGGKVTSRSVEELDLDQCWDERLLKQLLEECTDYEQRRRLRARIRTLMAEQEACASAVTEALGAAGSGAADGSDDAREEEEVTVTTSVRRDSSDKTVSSSTTTKTSKVIEMTRPAPKPVSPFAKFRQLEKQNSTNSPNSPKTPQSPGSPSQPYFKFTDPALQCSALTIKERLLQWCRDKTRDYENVKLENFSTSWADGLAFCALVHHFLPDAFDYSKLTADKRRHNFTLAFKVADEKAGIYPLLDVDDMVAMRKPDWKCVFTYVQAIYRRFKDEQ